MRPLSPPDFDNELNITSKEKVLIKKLIDRYMRQGKEGRPVVNTSDAVRVEFGLSLIQILDVDVKDQVLKTNVWYEYVSTCCLSSCPRALFSSRYTQVLVRSSCHQAQPLLDMIILHKSRSATTGESVLLDKWHHVALHQWSACPLYLITNWSLSDSAIPMTECSFYTASLVTF